MSFQFLAEVLSAPLSRSEDRGSLIHLVSSLQEISAIGEHESLGTSDDGASYKIGVSYVSTLRCRDCAHTCGTGKARNVRATRVAVCKEFARV